MTNYPLCLPLQLKTRTKVLQTIDCHPSYSFYEVWLGTITDLDDAFVSHLASLIGPKLIVLFRTKNMEITLPLQQRLYFLQQLSDTSSLIDLDVVAQQEELKFAKQEKLTLQKIISYHDYHRTPSDEKLDGLVKEILTHQPEIVKLAALCKSPSDGVRLLALGIKLRELGRRAVVVGMGPHGLVTRTFGTLWGNALAFAPFEKSAESAPGQLTEGELRALLASLER